MQYGDVTTNPKWQTDAILKMVLLLYLSRESSDFNQTWCADTDFGQSRDKISKFCKFKMADGHHIENRFLTISL